MSASTDEIVIRHAKPEEAGTVAALAEKLCRQHLNYHPVRFTDFPDLSTRLEDLFAEEIPSPVARVLVAELDGEITGYVFLKLEPDSIVEISDARVWLHDIYVEPAARGRGAGKKLLDAAIAVAREFNSKTLMLQVWPQNRAARDLFQQYGFRPTMQEMMLEIED